MRSGGQDFAKRGNRKKMYAPIANDEGYPNFVQDALPGCSVFCGQRIDVKVDMKGRENRERRRAGKWNIYWSLHA